MSQCRATFRSRENEHVPRVHSKALEPVANGFQSAGLHCCAAGLTLLQWNWNVMQADYTAWIWKNSLDSLSKKTLGGWKAISWVLSWRRDDDGCKMLQESPLFSWIYSTILVRTCQTWEHSSSEIDLKLCYFTVATWRQKLVASAQTSSKHFGYIDVEPSLDFLKVWSPHDL